MPAKSGLPPEVDLDLGEEARRFRRQRLPVTATGLGLGVAFIGAGGYLLGSLLRARFVPGEILSILLVGLGVGLIVLSLRTGLINPIVRLRADRKGLTYSWRSGAPLLRRWAEPGLVLVLDDLAPDARSSAEEKQHVYFAGPGSVYGNLPRDAVGPLLDAARNHGLTVGMKLVTERRGNVDRTMRRLRITREAES